MSSFLICEVRLNAEWGDIRWSDPAHEVRRRIDLFAERSPEILKPILESR